VVALAAAAKIRIGISKDEFGDQRTTKSIIIYASEMLPTSRKPATPMSNDGVRSAVIGGCLAGSDEKACCRSIGACARVSVGTRDGDDRVKDDRGRTNGSDSETEGVKSR